ncbi:hypothetical protein [Cohnella sp.]|uniref:hypothetical protein n=1 Tax=Cohnella sp. TaxID=1883426 RepID=UPI003561DE6F
MPEITPHIGLKKPLVRETADISVINDNMDVIDSALGDLASVPTAAKTAAGAITELFTNVSDGKALIASAITDKGVQTDANDSFAEMADNIEAIQTGTDMSDATATAADILAPKTAYGAAGTKLVGTMPNKTGATSGYTTLNDSTQGKDAKIVSLTDQHPDNSVALTFIPDKGYYDGVSSKARVRLWGVNPRYVAAGNPLGWISDAASTPLVGTYTSDANATNADILSGKTAYVNGVKRTGTIPIHSGQHYPSLGYNGSLDPGRIYLRVPEGWWDGNAHVYADDPNYIADNILAGKSIFGRAGTANSLVYLSSPNQGSTGGSTDLVILKKFTLSVQAVIRITYTVRALNFGLSNAQVYKNGAAVGPLRVFYNDEMKYSEDYACVAGDVFDIRLRTSPSGNSVFIYNVLVTNALTSPVGGSVDM